jgi:hypothetical protein
MPGYNGTYHGVVLDVADPMSEKRVQVQVPDVTGVEHAWARAEEPSASLPNVGDEVTVTFENGDEQYPVWRAGRTAAHQASASGGLPSTYRGMVIDNLDPGRLRRVAVQVPDVSTETMWATPEHDGAALPAIGDEVTVRFQNGDVQYPQWSGGSGTGERHAQPLAGTHPATVLSDVDPQGLGRLYVSVPGLAEGVWATPQQAPPVIGESVWVTFEGGSAEHARWTR